MTDFFGPRRLDYKLEPPPMWFAEYEFKPPSQEVLDDFIHEVDAIIDEMADEDSDACGTWLTPIYALVFYFVIAIVFTVALGWRWSRR